MKNKFMKKIAIVLAAATIATAAASAVVSANDGQGIEAETSGVSVQDMWAIKYVENEAGANVRTAPSQDAKIIKTLPNHAEVEVTGRTSNGWYQVWTSDPVYGGEGSFYISGNLLSDSKGDAYGAKRGSNEAYKSHYTVKGTECFLALRNAPTTDDDAIIEKLHNGDTVTVIDGSGMFWYVSSDNTGRAGYVNSNYLA